MSGSNSKKRPTEGTPNSGEGERINQQRIIESARLRQQQWQQAELARAAEF